MPVRKFRSIDMSEDTGWRGTEPPDLWKAIRAIWQFSRRVAPQRFVPGVHKWGSLGEARSIEVRPARARRS